MNSKNKVILYSLILGFILYIVDSLIYYLVFGDGSFIQVFITAVPLNEIYGRILMLGGVLVFGFLVSGMISDLQFENEFLKHQPASSNNKLDTDFISSLSYQIRTPLNAIVGFSELLKDPGLSAQSKQTYINHIFNSGNYLLQFINNIVDISKIETNQLAVSPAECRVNELMDEIYSHFEERKKEMGKADVAFILIKGEHDDNFSILTDRIRFRQVLVNLLENAFRHTEEGLVEFGYRIKEESLLEVYVKDTGQGFSMERLEIIFNRYRKLSDNHNQPFDTAALRLTISKSIVKLLGGNIRANSRPGQGSVFYFTLPYKAVDPVTMIEEMPENADPHKRDWSNKTLLIAEDVESNFIYLKELLRPTGIKLFWAQNGKDAVEQVKKEIPFDLVLMDILMPEMDGYEAAKKIKQLHPSLPIVAQTAYSLDSERDKEELKNFSEYLIKPIWSPQLMTAMDKFLES